MKNVIKFKTGDRPADYYSRKSRFPYADIIESLKVLDSTKSIIFKEGEISKFQIFKIRQYIKEEGYELRYCFHEREKEYRIWADKTI